MTMLPEPTEVMPTRNPATRPMSDIQANDFIVGGVRRSPIFDFLLEEQESRNANQQHSHCHRDEVIDAVAVDISQVDQKTHAQDKSPERCPLASAKTTLRRTVPLRR